ncbi:hypothetical protein HMPREF0880_02536 [Yokenella regensburgei ATCC 43003]|nr:hypothetical protein HMPREF0880_02536 [Yokenella regensburgei ATCC 43003]
MNGQTVDFVTVFMLETAFSRFIAVAVMLALAKAVLPAEGKNVTVKITVAGGGKWVGISAGRTKRGSSNAAGNNILPEHLYSQ